MNESDWREKLEFVMAENAQLREQLEFNQTPQVRFSIRANVRMFFAGTNHNDWRVWSWKGFVWFWALLIPVYDSKMSWPVFDGHDYKL